LLTRPGGLTGPPSRITSGKESKVTRQDYVAIAKVLKEHSELIGQSAFISLVDSFADMLQNNNGAFNRQKFERATGVKDIAHECF
jgi:hypothetical protein